MPFSSWSQYTRLVPLPTVGFSLLNPTLSEQLTPLPCTPCVPVVSRKTPVVSMGESTPHGTGGDAVVTNE